MKRDKNINWTKVKPMDLDLRGKRVAIIGGTGGIGRAFSRFMTSRGAQLIVVGQTFRDSELKSIEFIKADLSLMTESLRVAEQLPAETLDMIIFTTGIFASPKRQETDEGLEKDMAVSYLSRLVVLQGIAARLGKDRSDTGSKPRVFIMGYPGSGQKGQIEDLNAEKSYKAFDVHMNTVVGNEVLVLDSAKRYRNINFYGLNPGLIKTNIRDNFLDKNSLKSKILEGIIGLLMNSADMYAKRITPLLVSPDLEGLSGQMFNKKAQAIFASPELTESYTKEFLDASEKLVTGTKVKVV